MNDPNLNKRVTSRSPIHMLMIADNSSSMQHGDAARLVTDAIRAWVNELYMATRGTKPYFRFSLIVFGSDVGVTVEALDVRDINPQNFSLDGRGGTTNLTKALKVAKELLGRDGATAEHCPPFVFPLSDGAPTDDQGHATAEAQRAALSAAEELKALPLLCGFPNVVALGFGDVKDEFLRAVASDGLFRRIPNPRALIDLLPDIGTPTVYVDEDEDEDEGTLVRFRERIQEI
jgi:uncharacterized protein YegL